MAKILKKILFLIPFLIISFNIKNVYAEEYNIYLKYVNTSTPISITKVPDENVEYDFKYDFNLNGNIFKFYANTSQRVLYNSFIFYDREKDIYIFNNSILTNRNLNTSDYSINISCSNSNLNPFQRLNVAGDTWVQLTGNFDFVLTSHSISSGSMHDYFTYNFDSNVMYGSFDYYVYWYSSATNSNGNFYYCPNKNDLDLVYIYKDKMYDEGQEMSIVVPSPEEPEDPQEPTQPPYNFNNNKYYVPNYQEGNCVEVIDKDTIRVFENEFSLNYVDYYINSNYISKTGQVEIDYQKNCSTLQFTNIRYYGNDFPQILFILVCILIFTIGFPYILYKRFRKR